MNFYSTLTAAIQDIEAHGFDSQQRVDGWLARIEAAIRETMVPESTVDTVMRNSYRAIYGRLVTKGAALKVHPGVQRFTLANLEPRLRAELDRRIMASANLIRLNRAEAVSNTLRRFSGWSTSIPAGGAKGIDTADVRDNMRKPVKSLPFQERRVIVDQGHKLTAAIHDVIAEDGGAIAAEWHSQYRRAGYNYREDHKERDGRILLIRGSWADKQGLVKGVYTDEITKPGEEVYCSCTYHYKYSLNQLPETMLTAKGRKALG